MFEAWLWHWGVTLQMNRSMSLWQLLCTLRCRLRLAPGRDILELCFSTLKASAVLTQYETVCVRTSLAELLPENTAPGLLSLSDQLIQEPLARQLINSPSLETRPDHSACLWLQMCSRAGISLTESHHNQILNCECWNTCPLFISAPF